jgi:hypothetical protein
VVDFRLRGRCGSSIPCLGGKAGCFQAGEAIEKSLCTCQHFLFFGLILAQVALRRSAYGYVTEYEALQYVSYGIVLLIGAECVREEEARKIFAFVMIFFGAGYAFFALVQELTANGKIFWVHSPHFHGSIYGSYVNHDHYAGLMEMLVPLPFVVSMGHLLEGGSEFWSPSARY